MTSAKPSTRRVEREDVLLWVFAFTPVLAWIAAQQLSFVVTRSICRGGHRWALYLIMGPSLATAAAAGTASWKKWNALASRHSKDRMPTYRPFMALGGVLLAAISVLAIVSLMIPAALHRLCD